MEAGDYLLATLEALAIPVAIVRREDSLILFANRRLSETMRVPPGTPVGLQSLSFYVDPTRRQNLFEAMERAGGRLVDHELAVKRGDGTVAHLSLSIEVIEFSGDPCNLISAIDITTRCEAELRVAAEQRLLRRLVALTERDRQLLGFELHDGIVQEITAATMFLQGAAAELATTTGTVNESLTSCETLLRDALQEARRLIDGLRPPNLDEGNVIVAIERLVGEVRDQAGIEIASRFELNSHQFIPALEHAVYRIVQAALQNVATHSRATRAEIAITVENNMVRVAVADDGVGFDVAAVPHKRYGLLGIRERARLLGGFAAIESQVGQGTRIVVDLPVVDTLMAATAH